MQPLIRFVVVLLIAIVTVSANARQVTYGADTPIAVFKDAGIADGTVDEMGTPTSTINPWSIVAFVAAGFGASILVLALIFGCTNARISDEQRQLRQAMVMGAVNGGVFPSMTPGGLIAI